MRTRARSVVVAAFGEVELLDLAAPLEVLAVAGRRWNFRPYKVQLCAASAGLLQTRNQVRVEAAFALSEIASAEILIVPGGYGARRAAEDAAFVAEIRRLAESAELVAALGLGVLVLARAGLLAAGRVAASPETAELLREVTPEVSIDGRQAVSAAGRILTARASGGAVELALAIVEKTMGPKLVGLVQAELGLGGERIDVSYGHSGRPPRTHE